SSDASIGTCPLVITRTYTITDACGNSTTVTQTINVNDTQAPVITCPATQAFCFDASNNYSIPVLTATDNCTSNLTITYQVTGATTRSGTGTDASGVFNQGASTITWTVTDACGNTATCTTTVTINNGVHTDTTAVACKSFTWNRDGQTYTVSGTHDFIFDNAQGCKDTVTLHLTI